MQISDLSAEQQQQLAMQEGASTPEDMILVLKTLAEDPENLARALSMMGIDVSPEQVQQAAAWMDQSAGASAGIPPEGEQAAGDAGAAAGDDDTVAPPASEPAAPTDEEGVEDTPAPEPVVGEAEAEAEAPTPMPPQGVAPMPRGKMPAGPSMDDVVSASVMQGAPGPAPQMRGAQNFSKMKGPAGLRRPAGGGGGNPQDAIMKLLMSRRSAK